MPQHDKNTVDSPPNRPKTRQKNATTHPGTDAKKALSTRRDPEVIEKEKLGRQAKKEAKERHKVEEAARKEVAQQRVEDLRAQQAIELQKAESEVKRIGNKKNLQVPGKSKTTKGTKATNTAAMAGNRGLKRKADMREDDAAISVHDSDHDESPPAKKGRSLPATNQQTRPVPRPLPKKTQAVHQEAENSSECRNTNKRSSEAADISDHDMVHPEGGPKTPAPSKRAKTGLKDVPTLRRTETMIELVESNVVTRRPTDLDHLGESDIYMEDADDEKTTPNPRTLKTTENVDTEPEPYCTPVALTPANWRKKTRTRRLVPVEDTDIESSDTGFEVVQPLREESKKHLQGPGVPKSSTDSDKLSATTHLKSTGNKSHSSHNTPSLSSRTGNAKLLHAESRTTASNKIAAARSESLDGPTSKVKPKSLSKNSKSKKPGVSKDDELETAPVIDDEDDTKEREAALSSPMKGKDSQQLTATRVKVEHGEEILFASEKKKIKDDVIPHFMQNYTSEVDCFAPLTEKDFRLLEDICHRVMGKPLPYKITKNSEVVKMVSAKLSDYRTQFRIQGDSNARDLFNVYFNSDVNAIQDEQKRIEFGLYYCKEDEYKFQFRGSERPVGNFKASGRFLSKIFLDTFSIHYRYVLPKHPLPNWDTPIPVGGLALAAAAIDRAITLYRDDHYVYNLKNNNLSIKQPPVSQAAKEKAIKSRAARGVTECDNDRVPGTSKFHFSKGKYGNVVLAWHGVLIRKAKANFSDICAQARNIFRATDVVGKGSQQAQTVDPEIMIRVGLDSESESDKGGKDNADNGVDEDLQDHDDDSDRDDENLQDHDDDDEDEDLQDYNNKDHGNDGTDDDVVGPPGGNDGNEEVDHGGPSHHGGHQGGRRSSRGGRK